MMEEEIKQKRTAVLKEYFASPEDWVKHWLALYYKHTSYKPTVFYSPDGFMNLKGLMTEATTTDIDALAIFCTDKLSSYDSDKDIEYRRFTFYVCRQSSDPNDGDENELARMNCLEDVNEFRKFLKASRYLNNPNTKPCNLREIGVAESGAPFLDGWESIRVQMEYVNSICPEPTWAKYGL